MTRRVSLKPYLSLTYVMYLNSDMYPFLSSNTNQTQASIWVKIGLLQPSLETVVPEGATPNLQLLSMLQEDKVRPSLLNGSIIKSKNNYRKVKFYHYSTTVHNGVILWVWRGRIGEYRLSPERLGAIPSWTLEDANWEYGPTAVGQMSVLYPNLQPTGEGGIAPNLEGRRQYSPICPSQTHSVNIVIK